MSSPKVVFRGLSAFHHVEQGLTFPKHTHSGSNLRVADIVLTTICSNIEPQCILMDLCRFVPFIVIYIDLR